MTDLESLAALTGKDRARAVKALTPDEVLAVLAQLAPRIVNVNQSRDDSYDLRKQLIVCGSAKGLSRVALADAAKITATAVKFQAGVPRWTRPEAS